MSYEALHVDVISSISFLNDTRQTFLSDSALQRLRLLMKVWAAGKSLKSMCIEEELSSHGAETRGYLVN